MGVEGGLVSNQASIAGCANCGVRIDDLMKTRHVVQLPQLGGSVSPGQIHPMEKSIELLGLVLGNRALRNKDCGYRSHLSSAPEFRAMR